MSTKPELRMEAYYFGFGETGARSIDRVLSAVACAGKAFHHTEQWTEKCEAYHAEMVGSSCQQWIQNAADVAALETKDLLSALKDARSVLSLADRSDAWRKERDRCLSDLAAAIAKAEGSP